MGENRRPIISYTRRTQSVRRLAWRDSLDPAVGFDETWTRARFSARP